ncbi:MAG: rhodanese-like domain-containing protein [Nitrospirae bacterium]|nr:rhodanese-like domain-containing protein [Nitrospirota bacterium]
MKTILVTLAFSFSLLLAIASAQDLRSLPAEDLKKLMDTGARIALVDARTEKEYGEGHLPKAINIPFAQFNLMGRMLPKDKGVHVIFYCRGYS